MSYQHGATLRLPPEVITRLRERDQLAHENQQLKRQLEECQGRLAARTHASEAQTRRINDLETRLHALTADLAHPGRKAEAECSTYSGYIKHLRSTHTTPCEPCKQANNAYQRNYRRERAARLRAVQ